MGRAKELSQTHQIHLYPSARCPRPVPSSDQVPDNRIHKHTHELAANCAALSAVAPGASAIDLKHPG